MTLSDTLRAELTRLGAALVGYGDLTSIPPGPRQDLPIGVCVAVLYPMDVIRGIAEHPTRAYREQYDLLNERLDWIVTSGAEYLQARGYRAIPQTRAEVGTGADGFSTPLPHKTVATRAGLGWIGRCALLVTPAYGSMVRISAILTDAELEAAAPVDAARCGSCDACRAHCPGNAVKGPAWDVTKPRAELFDAPECRMTARERSMRYLSEEITLCGRCIAVCPYTRRYLEADEGQGIAD